MSDNCSRNTREADGRKNTLCEPLACASERRNPLARANESVCNEVHSIIYIEVPFPFTAASGPPPTPFNVLMGPHLPIQASLSSG